LEDGFEAVNGTLVEAVGDGLFGLEHHTTADGVEGVVEGHDDGTGSGDSDEGGDGSEGTLVLLVGVQVLDLGEASELTSTVDEGTNDGDGPAGVETSDTLGLDGGGDAVTNSGELGLAGTDVGGEAGTGEIEGVADGVGDGTSAATGGELGAEGLPEVGLGVVLGEDLVVDEIVEGEGGTLLGSITEAVDEVTSPEGFNTLFGGDTLEAVKDTIEALDLSADDIRVGVHSLEEELDTFDGGHGGLGDGTSGTSEDEILSELFIPGLGGLLDGSLSFSGHYFLVYLNLITNLDILYFSFAKNHWILFLFSHNFGVKQNSKDDQKSLNETNHRVSLKQGVGVLFFFFFIIAYYFPGTRTVVIKMFCYIKRFEIIINNNRYSNKELLLAGFRFQILGCAKNKT
jgi:hypothetical protein